MPSVKRADGKWIHTFSASWLKDFATCPERARRRYFGLLPKGPTDFTALGSAVHAGIEHALLGHGGESEGPAPVALEAAKAAGLEVLEGIEADPEFREVKHSASERRRLLDQHLSTFYSEVLDSLQPVVVEHSFDVPLHSDPLREIRLRGRIDCVDARMGPIDWKTAGSPHKTWEAERWDVQSTVYLHAEAARTGRWADSMRYVVFVHDKDPQTYTVIRQEGHLAWLVRQCLAAAQQVEAGLPAWTMNDAGWHCSAKWCPAYDHGCKGSVIESANPLL